MEIKPRYGLGVTLVMLIVASFFIYWLSLRYFQVDLSKRGLWGDSFGGLNALFSGLAFAGLIYALYLQLNELRLQRIEIAENRQELNKQRIAIERQNENIVEQKNLQTFFELVALHNSNVDRLTLNVHDEKKVNGKTVFQFIEDELNSYFNPIQDDTTLSYDTIKRQVSNSYTNINNKYEYILNQYFSNVISLFEAIYQLEFKNSTFYNNIVINQLSDSEQKLIFYYFLNERKINDNNPNINAALNKISRNIQINKMHLNYYKHLGL